MKIKTLLAMLFSVMLICGAATFINGQNSSDQKPKSTDKQKDDDRDDDDEEDDSPEMQAKLAKQAKISIEEARKIALEKVRGTITEEEIEKEHGVIVYSIEIRDENGKTFDVEVDVKTGKIVRVEEENEDDDEEDANTAKQKKTKEKSVRKISQNSKKPY
jgi:hypothetical protein